MTDTPSPLKIRFVKPGDKVPTRRKRTFEEIGLRHEMSQFYSLKATFEALFGRPMYYELKENTDLSDWKNACKKLLKAVSLSAKSSVQVADSAWFEHMDRTIEMGQERIRIAETAADLFSGLSATLIELVFTQFGFMPTRARSEKMVPLSKDYWTLDNFRTVQYVQSPKQKEAMEEYRARLTTRHSHLTSA